MLHGLHGYAHLQLILVAAVYDQRLIAPWSLKKFRFDPSLFVTPLEINVQGARVTEHLWLLAKGEDEVAVVARDGVQRDVGQLTADDWWWGWGWVNKGLIEDLRATPTCTSWSDSHKDCWSGHG